MWVGAFCAGVSGGGKILINQCVGTMKYKRGVFDGGLGFTYQDKFAYIPPRTVGLSVTRTF